MHIPSQIAVCEVGLRDGLQNEEKILTTAQKNQLLELIQEAGIRMIEIGSFVNPKAVPQMADTEDVFRRIKQRDGIEYRALILNQKGLERAASCGIRKAKFTISASQTHQAKNARRSQEELFEQLATLSVYAKDHAITFSGAIATAFGCPFEGIIPVEKVEAIAKNFVAVGIHEISLSDTTGMANPKQVYTVCTKVRKDFSDVVWNLHFHNTRGMGLANVLAGMQAGITRYDASIGGLGGCPFAPGATGNIATEDLVHMCGEMGIHTDVNIDTLLKAARMLQGFIGRELPGTVLKAGKNSDLHRSCE